MVPQEQASQQSPVPRSTESLHPALKLRYTLGAHAHNVFGISLSPDGRILASHSADAKVHIWDVEIGQHLRTLTHKGSVASVAWSPDGTSLATSGDRPNDIYVWNAISWTQDLHIAAAHGGRVRGVAWSPSGKVLASFCRTIRLWDRNNGLALQELRGHAKGVYSVAWSPDNERLCSGSKDGTVRLWNTVTGECIRTLVGHKNEITCVACSPDLDKQHIASGSSDQTIRIWDPKTGRQTYVLVGRLARPLPFQPA